MQKKDDFIKFFVALMPEYEGLSAETSPNIYLTDTRTGWVFMFDRTLKVLIKTKMTYAQLFMNKDFKEVQEYDNGYVTTEQALNSYFHINVLDPEARIM